MACAGLDAFLSDDLAPAFWTPDLQIEESRWWPHVPFAFWLVAAAKPRSLVELGAYRGVSYTAFCEAAQRLGLNARFCAVDTWTGDRETGFYDDDIFQNLWNFHARRYASFSTLLRSTFERALPGFADGSIDLLHLDGLHDYEDARANLEMWNAKLSPRGVILLHGTRLHGDDFGVGRLFEELCSGAPHFEFAHGDGLGVICPGVETPPPIAALCGLRSADDIATIRTRFEFLGSRWSERAIALSLVQQFEGDITALEQRIRFPLHQRFARSVLKTLDDPLRHFKKRKRTSR